MKKIDWKKQEKKHQNELRESGRVFKKRKKNTSVLVRFPEVFYNKLKREAKLRQIPMSKLLLEKLPQCTWIRTEDILQEQKQNLNKN